jgi:RHS repeat-associated protein
VVKVEAQHNGLYRKFVDYAYNEAGDLIAITDANGKTTSILYQNHLMVEKTDRNGQTFYWKYDGFSTGSRCIHTYGEGGILEGSIDYKERHNIITNSLGEQKIYYYDEKDLCIQETDALGNSVFHQYTDSMEPYRDIDEEGNITGYVYDARGNMTARQAPDGSVNNFLYDERGKLQIITDAEGASTVYVYKNNALSAVIGAGSALTAYEYNDAGLVKTIKNAKGQKTLLLYDSDHNLVQITLPDGAEAFRKYDDWGRCVATINPELQAQQLQYDALDRVTSVKNYDGNFIQLEYNAYEEVTKASDKHSTVQFEYTPLGSVKTREQNGTKLEFHYNTEERLTYLKNEANNVYRFGYNSRGEIIKEVGFDGLERGYERDRAGKVIRTQRPGGRSNLYEYDANGRIIRTEYHDGTWEIFSYDKNGILTEAANASSSTRFKRNKLGLVEEEKQNGHTLQSKYDEFGNRTNIQSSLGASILQQRDSAGNVTELKATMNDRVWQTQMKYNRAGQEIEKLLPGDILSQWQYDQAGRPSEHIVKKGEQYQRSKEYNWKVDDRLSSIFDALTQNSTRFNHDDVGNLVWAKYGDNSIIHRQADDIGNLYETEDRSDRKYGPGGKLLESKKHLYKYDEEGNLISKTDKQTRKKWNYEWCANGMLQKVIRPDSKEVAFKYDALGRRTEKCFNKTITRWLWDGNVPLHEWQYPKSQRPKPVVDEWGNITYDKPEPTDQLTTWIFDADSFRPAAKIINGQTHSIVCDYLGTPQEMYDEQGTKVWEGVLDIYGRLVTLKGSKGDCPFRYQGQYEDGETGLYYNRFRYYAPEEGMYVSQDPIRLAGGKELYRYVGDTNVGVDVLGLAEWVPYLLKEGNVFRGVNPDLPEFSFSPDQSDLEGVEKSPGISAKFKDNNSNRNWFAKKGEIPIPIDVAKLSKLEAFHDKPDHVSLRPSLQYLELKNMNMKEALEDWSEGGDKHELSIELLTACR